MDHARHVRGHHKHQRLGAPSGEHPRRHRRRPQQWRASASPSASPALRARHTVRAGIKRRPAAAEPDAARGGHARRVRALRALRSGPHLAGAAAHRIARWRLRAADRAIRRRDVRHGPLLHATALRYLCALRCRGRSRAECVPRFGSRLPARIHARIGSVPAPACTGSCIGPSWRTPAAGAAPRRSVGASSVLGSSHRGDAPRSAGIGLRQAPGRHGGPGGCRVRYGNGQEPAHLARPTV